jgi:hypothetical protein
MLCVTNDRSVDSVEVPSYLMEVARTGFDTQEGEAG